MRQSTREKHIQMLVDLREEIGYGDGYREADVLFQCSRAYGLPQLPGYPANLVERQKWGYWKERCLVSQDSPENSLMSQASGLLLLSLAWLLRPNNRGSRVQVSRLRLVKATRAALSDGCTLVDFLPEALTYWELRDHIENQQAFHEYCDRHHRRNGLLKEKQVYSRAEAIVIKSKYPDHRHVCIQQVS